MPRSTYRTGTVFGSPSVSRQRFFFSVLSPSRRPTPLLSGQPARDRRPEASAAGAGSREQVMLTDAIPRVRLAHLPTPIEPLERLSAHLRGPQLFVKRDDLTGLATGGNKVRKLEFVLADALAQGVDTLVTCGAAQSNQARQTAAAAARCGLSCVLVLVRPPVGEEPQGNWLLDRLLGAEIRWIADRAELTAAAEAAAGELRERGRRPYVVPYGASSALGVLGYVSAMEEIALQGTFDHVVL